jgi:hypothetical protein
LLIFSAEKVITPSTEEILEGVIMVYLVAMKAQEYLL